MHVVDDGAAAEDNHQIFRGEADSTFLHGLRNPHAGILCHTNVSFHHTDVSHFQFLGPAHGVGIQLSLHPFHIAGNHARLRISFAHRLIQVVTGFQLHKPRTSCCRGFLCYYSFIPFMIRLLNMRYIVFAYSLVLGIV